MMIGNAGRRAVPPVLGMLLALAAAAPIRAEDIRAENIRAEDLWSYPDPTRWEDAVRAFEASDLAAPPPADALLCIGSSSMRMWHETIEADLAPLAVIPRGFGGSTMYDVLHFAGRIVLPYRPRAVLLYEGDNDIDSGVPPQRVAAVFAEFVSQVHAQLPQTRIHVLSIKPSPARWSKWPQMQAANALLQAACAGDSTLAYVDVATPMLGPDGRPRSDLFLADQLHLSARGYALWTEVVRREVVSREVVRGEVVRGEVIRGEVVPAGRDSIR